MKYWLCCVVTIVMISTMVELKSNTHANIGLPIPTQACIATLPLQVLSATYNVQCPPLLSKRWDFGRYDSTTDKCISVAYHTVQSYLKTVAFLLERYIYTLTERLLPTAVRRKSLLNVDSATVFVIQE
jgi:hypothetical protein